MALIMEVVTPSGITVTDSYARVEHINGSKLGLVVNIRYYVSQEMADDNLPFVHEGVYSFLPSVEDKAPNFIRQVYEHLKSLPEFASAIDA